MLTALRKRLTVLYTFTTGFVLTVIVMAALMMSENQYYLQTQYDFNTRRDNLTYKLQADSYITSTYLAQTEAEALLMIQIEDNGVPFQFSGSWTPLDNRQELIDKIQQLALEDGIDTKRYPLAFEQAHSSLFKIYGDNHRLYYGSVTILPSAKGWKSLTLLRYLPNNQLELFRLRALYVFFDIIGIAAFFVVSWIFVGHSLKPIAENQKRQTEFIAAASHELRSPLSVIRASTSAMAVDRTLIPKFINNIETECVRMTRLIEDMLLLASADAQTWSLKKEKTDIDTLLIEIYEKFQPFCQQKNQKLFLDLPDDPLPLMKVDKLRMVQLLTIFLDNAISYTPPGGEIKIKVHSSTNTLSIAVMDTGTGISDKEKSLVFHRFYRTDTAREDKTHFGLGLSIAQELVRLHRGKIYIKDTPGGGATFVIELPIFLE